MSENTAPMQGLAAWLRSHAEFGYLSQDARADILRWADEVEAAASAGQALGLYAEREADIKAYLDEVAPGTQGNILERIKQAIESSTTWEKTFKAHTTAVQDFLNELYAIMVTPCAVGEVAVKDVQAALVEAAFRSREPASLPIQAVPMTVEQIDFIANNGLRNAVGGIYATRVYEFARAIEAHHGIGTAQPASEPIPAATAQAEPVPVAWQIRRTDGSPLATWEDCTQANYQRTRDSGRYWGFGNGPNAEARALVVQQTSPKGAAPPTAEQIESLRQWFIRNHKFWLTRDSIRAALEDAGIGGAPSVQDAWRAIESAPRDGTRILGWNEAYGMRETKMHLYGEGSPGYTAWKVGKGPREAGWDWSEPKNNWSSSWKPSHWQPLPPPPGIPQGEKR